MLEYFLVPAKVDLLPMDRGRGVVRPLRPPWLRAWLIISQSWRLAVMQRQCKKS